jgi:hypothetical protein
MPRSQILRVARKSIEFRIKPCTFVSVEASVNGRNLYLDGSGSQLKIAGEKHLRIKLLLDDTKKETFAFSSGT